MEAMQIENQVRKMEKEIDAMLESRLDDLDAAVKTGELGKTVDKYLHVLVVARDNEMATGKYEERYHNIMQKYWEKKK